VAGWQVVNWDVVARGTAAGRVSLDSRAPRNCVTA
jgi:hypothetical protein